MIQSPKWAAVGHMEWHKATQEMSSVIAQITLSRPRELQCDNSDHTESAIWAVVGHMESPYQPQEIDVKNLRWQSQIRERL